MKKYKLTDETCTLHGVTMYRIEALIDFDNVKAGDKGGFVQSEDNLSQEGKCWVGDNAKVFGSAKVFGDAVVFGNAEVYGDAKVYDYAKIYGDAIVCGSAKVFGNAEVYGDALVFGNAEVYDYAEVFGNAEVCGNAEVTKISDYIVFKNWWSSGRYFTWTRSNNMWRVGGFYGTSQELIKKAYADSNMKGQEYERVVRYVESILADETKKTSNE